MRFFSNNSNPKIPKSSLHEAMRDGGLKNIATAKEPVELDTGSNDAKEVFKKLKNHVHMGSYNL